MSLSLSFIVVLMAWIDVREWAWVWLSMMDEKEVEGKGPFVLNFWPDGPVTPFFGRPS
jgi:hypothetical protein